MKKITILGSTGSIGRQTLDIVRLHSTNFRVFGLSANRNVELLRKQVEEFNPTVVAVADPEQAQHLEVKGVKILAGPEGIKKLAASSEPDLVVNSIVGSAGLEATISTLEANKTVALANKESMVAGGEIILRLLARSKGKIIPIDSEHSALFQCLLGEEKSRIRRIIITGSGGPFRGRKLKSLERVSVEEALAHPRWKMGPKISIDSATLMNKGLEVIEAHFLFGASYEQIEVLIHPQSIVHSLVEFNDGSVKAQLGPTDMKLPIQYALTFPQRLPSPVTQLDFVKLGQLTFETPDLNNFPCLSYAIEAGKKGMTYSVVLNAANEEAVAAFLGRKISFPSIPKIIYSVLEAHQPVRVQDIKVVREVEQWARQEARQIIVRKERE